MKPFSAYLDSLHRLPFQFDKIAVLGDSLRSAWQDNRQVFICGNGGSAANALHIANDLFYGVASLCGGAGIRAHAMPANQSIVSCLANDASYANIFSDQLRVYAQPGDLLIALSGSGNSPNIVKALEMSRELGMESFAILGYSGGKCLALADTAIHFAIDDMQISEDAQLIVGHMLMQWLKEGRQNREEDHGGESPRHRKQFVLRSVLRSSDAQGGSGGCRSESLSRALPPVPPLPQPARPVAAALPVPPD